MPQQKIRIEIPDDFGPDERDSIGKEIVEYIRERSLEGVGVKESARGFRNYAFPKYSESYMSSTAFKKAGKSSRVDLTLSGDMLDAMDVLKHGSGYIEIGFERGAEENARAEGNILGSYGGSPNPKKARNFLGLTQDELQEILDNHGG